MPKQLFAIMMLKLIALSYWREIDLLTIPGYLKTKFIMIKFIFTNVVTNMMPSFIKSSALLKWLIQIQPAKGIEYGKEGIFTRWIFILIILMISYLQKDLRMEKSIL